MQRRFELIAAISLGGVYARSCVAVVIGLQTSPFRNVKTFCEIMKEQHGLISILTAAFKSPPGVKLVQGHKILKLR